jgi:hypothetical protein
MKAKAAHSEGQKRIVKKSLYPNNSVSTLSGMPVTCKVTFCMAIETKKFVFKKDPEKSSDQLCQVETRNEGIIRVTRWFCEKSPNDHEKSPKKSPNQFLINLMHKNFLMAF